MPNSAEGFLASVKSQLGVGVGGKWQDPANDLNFLSSLFPTVSKTMPGLPCFEAHTCSSNPWEEEAG